MTTSEGLQHFVNARMEDLFFEWLCLPESQKLVKRVINLAKGGMHIILALQLNFHRLIINQSVKSYSFFDVFPFDDRNSADTG